jgi:hypothetical protein
MEQAMRRLAGTELASIGRRVQTEIDVDGVTEAIRQPLIRLMDVEAAAQIRSGPNAMRVNGYL